MAFTPLFRAPSPQPLSQAKGSELVDFFPEARGAIRVTHGRFLHFAQHMAHAQQHLYGIGVDDLGGKSMFDAVALALQALPRALTHQAGTIALLEQGLHVEALTLTRSIYEAAFWIGYLATGHQDASRAFMAANLVTDTELRELRIVALGPDDPVSVKDREVLGRRKKSLQTAKKRRLNLEEVARRAQFADEWYFYKRLCSIAAHTSARSTLSYVDYDSDQRPSLIRLGAESIEMDECFYHLFRATMLILRTQIALLNVEIPPEIAKLVSAYTFEMEALLSREHASGDPL